MKYPKIKTMLVLSGFLALLSFGGLIFPYFRPGVPYTHDGNNHLVRFANYRVAVREGQFPPRFAPNLFNRYGYPVFNYNYPLANLLSLPLSFAGINYQLTFKLLMIGFFVLGGVGLWRWIELLGVKSRSAKLLALACFYSAPFTVNLIYVRGNIGEVMALNLLIWLFVLVERLRINKDKQNRKPVPLASIPKLKTLLFLMLGAFYILSHNVTVLFGTGIWLIYGFIRLRWNKSSKNRDKKISLSRPLRLIQEQAYLQLVLFLLAWIALGLWFWLPALWEKGEVVLDQVSLSQNFADHFPTASQLLFSPLEFGFSYPGSVDSLSFSLGLAGLLALISASWFVKKLKPAWRLIIGLSWLLILFQLSLTRSVWLLIPFGNYIQFPWRLSLFFVIFASSLVGFISQKKRVRWALLVVIAWQVVSVWKFSPVDYRNLKSIDYDANAESSTTLNENRVKGFEYSQIADWQPSPKILEGQGIIEVQNWRGSSRQYKLVLQQKSTIVEPTMKFAGWVTTANDQQVEYLDNPDILGRLAYQLPAGTYQIKSRFTQQTTARLVGNSVSALAWLTFIVFGLLRFKLLVPLKKNE
ncbi:MAG: hypothetical protein GF381_00865 [Candidatus Pacebacteria bacterium]|nr:hypothetical protein [Candidatus Paceibacterota bacterium]